MKCPKCGKEIANDSQFCEFCGTKLSIKEENHHDTQHPIRSNACPPKESDDKFVKSSWVVSLLFINLFFSIFGSDPLRRALIGDLFYLLNYVYHPGLRWIAYENVCVFACCLVLAIENKIRKSTAIALCAMSACISISTFYDSLTSYIMESELYHGITGDFFSSVALDVAVGIAIIYALYLLIAKWKNIKF